MHLKYSGVSEHSFLCFIKPVDQVLQSGCGVFCASGIAWAPQGRFCPLESIWQREREGSLWADQL